MGKIISIVGNRPQFIKMAPVANAIRDNGYEDIIIHTGQHYDHSLSGVFFKELGMPSPNIELTISTTTHGAMTAELLTQLEQQFQKEKPSGIILYGDTNSTLAGALAAAKLHIPIAHIEAGPRTYDMRSPEEVNRVVTDHISAFHFTPDSISVDNLRQEGFQSSVHFFGDVMFDAFIKFNERALQNNLSHQVIDLSQIKDFTLLTVHRQENTDSIESMQKLIQFLQLHPRDIIFPMHPRFIAKAKQYQVLKDIEKIPHLHTLPAIGYLETLRLINLCSQVVCDSGGLQKEAFFANKPCGVLLDKTPWPQILDSGWQIILGTLPSLNTDLANHRLKNFSMPQEKPSFFGHGDAAKKIIAFLISQGWFR